MKHQFVIITLFFGLYLMASQAQAQYTGDSYAKAKDTKSANLTLTYVETPGFASLSNKGEVVGLCIDLMDRFAAYVQAQEGITVNYEWQNASDPRDFKLFMSAMSSSKGGVFGLGNITITEERKKQYHFSPSFISNVTVIISHNSVSTLKDVSQIATQFKDMYAITVRGTTNEQRIFEIKDEYWPSMEIRHTGSSNDLIDIIKSDPKAFSNMDFTYYLGVLKNQLPLKRHPVGDQSAEEFGIIMPQTNDWTPLMDSFLLDFKGTTEYDMLINKHLGSNALALIKAVAKQ